MALRLEQRQREARDDEQAAEVHAELEVDVFRRWSSILPAMPIPAEFTSTSSPPYRSRCAATRRSQSSSFDTSAAIPSAPSSAAAGSTFSARREASVSS